MSNTPDFRLSCRTIYLNPVFRLLYWQMNYHIEHHMFAAVPCYNLKKCHEAILHELPPTNNGLLETWLEILTIQKRQKQEPDYEYIQSMPKGVPGVFSEEQGGDSKVALSQTSPTQPKGDYKLWECTICAFIYDEAKGLPSEGIQPGTLWADIPEDWTCPDCGTTKAEFDMIEVSRTEAPSQHSSTQEQKERVVIIGSGLAAYTLSKELRQRGSISEIWLLTKDKGDLYSKPMISTAFAASKDADALIQKECLAIAEELNLKIMANTEVRAIDSNQKEIKLDSSSIPYDKLVLALGADPIDLKIEGTANHKVFSVNDLESYRHFRSALTPNARVTIIGAGLIGCEFANDLTEGSYNVTVVDAESSPLARLVPMSTGASLKIALEERGVEFIFDDTISKVNASSNACSVELNSGKTLECDIVLSAVGLIPRTALARAAGIEVERGITTDTFCKTNIDGVYAIGDCAQQNGTCKPFILPLKAQAKALAESLSTGTNTAIDDHIMPVTIKTPALPMTVLPAPANCEGSWSFTGEGQNHIAKFTTPSGALKGFVLCGDQKRLTKEYCEMVEQGLTPCLVES